MSFDVIEQIDCYAGYFFSSLHIFHLERYLASVTFENS